MAYLDLGKAGEAQYELCLDLIDLLVTRVEFAERAKGGDSLARVYDDSLLTIDVTIAESLATETTAKASEVTNRLAFAINQVVQARRNVKAALGEIYSAFPIE